MAENRLNRWSRLKRKGGADTREESTAADDRERAAVAEAEADPDFAKLPGGVQVRHFVPAMPPLAPDDGDDDTVPAGAYETETASVVEAEDDVLFAGIEDEELTDEQRETVAALPPLESIDADSDISPFMRDGVPEFLKRKALRMLWRKDPFFNVRDGLNDYDEDFNIVHKVIDELVGQYKVGRGHLSDEELKQMTPEEARKVFYPDDDDENEDGEDEELAVKTAETGGPDGPDDDEDDVGDGDDDSLV